MLTQALLIALATSVDAAYLRASESRRLAGHGGDHDDNGSLGGCTKRASPRVMALDEARRRTPWRELGLARTPLWEIHGSRLFAGFFVVHEAGEGGVHLWRCHRSRGQVKCSWLNILMHRVSRSRSQHTAE